MINIDMGGQSEILWEDWCHYQITSIYDLIEIEVWRNEQLGSNNWAYGVECDPAVFSFANKGDSTLFLLRWA